MLFANARNVPKKPLVNNTHSNAGSVEGSSHQRQPNTDDSSEKVMEEESCHENQDDVSSASVKNELELNHPLSEDAMSSTEELRCRRTARLAATEEGKSNSPKPSSTASEIGNPVVKRPRGRPRKIPLPVNNAPSPNLSIESDTVDRDSLPANVTGKRKIVQEEETKDENKIEHKKLRAPSDSEETKMKYQQYWEKYCAGHIQQRKSDTPQTVMNCGSESQNVDTEQSNSTEEPDSRLLPERSSNEKALQSCEELSNEVQISENIHMPLADSANQNPSSSSSNLSSQEGKRPTRRR